MWQWKEEKIEAFSSVPAENCQKTMPMWILPLLYQLVIAFSWEANIPWFYV